MSKLVTPLKEEDDYFFQKSVMTGTHLMMGNSAMVEGCLAAGCRFFAGYPITPQNEVPERMSQRLPEVGGVYMQMEDEIGSISAVTGACLGGLKAMTSTSGPGFSLMQETMSLAALEELPIVVGEVQRVGPGSGIVSLPTHGDVTQFKRGGNGDYEIITVAPNSAQELFDLSIEAFNLAEIWRNPVIIMSDAWLGHIHEKVVIPPADEIKKRIVPRKRYAPDEKLKLCYTKANADFTEFDIPPLPLMGTTQFPMWMPTITHTKTAFGTEEINVAEDCIMTLNYKITKNEAKIAKTEEFFLDDCDILVIAYGLTSRTALEAVNMARAEGIKTGLLRLITVWPTAVTAIRKASQAVKTIVMPEMNLGQIAGEVERISLKEGVPVHLLSWTAHLHEPEEILSKIKEVA
ncbi:MAG: 2-oxoacid:acceptor oxidoreductase subunit alpha [Candidatus Helarchaeota archaeon]|nr:2-oxoacid:acceptor oxidoreductase subunit alpha [Candidatus Helarchaeota archaeon]